MTARPRVPIGLAGAAVLMNMLKKIGRLNQIILSWRFAEEPRWTKRH
jgi:hypothetical protein